MDTLLTIAILVLLACVLAFLVLYESRRPELAPPPKMKILGSEY